MQTDKPLISILMAVYEPRMDWLREQLNSLEAQTYPNLRLYIRDDCSPNVSQEEIEKCVKSCIVRFPYEINRNERNLGSNRTFERLTRTANGEYFAYCDQDDIWLPEKILTLYQALTRSRALLVCSDMNVMDENGKRYAHSITEVRKHHKFRSGEGLAPGLLTTNFVTGCTMMLDSGTAKAALPFCPYMVHDHYLAFYAASKGALLALPERLIDYRIHRDNQTKSMAGVRDKDAYFRLRIQMLVERMRWLRQAFAADEALSREIDAALYWAQARADNFVKRDWRAKRAILKYRRFSPMTSLFEVLLSGAPETVFMAFVEMKRKNWV